MANIGENLKRGLESRPLWWIGGSWSIYVLLILALGREFSPLVLIPVLMTAWQMGVRAGVLAGAAGFALNGILHWLFFPVEWDWHLVLMGTMQGVALMVTGGLVGRQRVQESIMEEKLGESERAQEALKVQRDLALSVATAPSVSAALDLILNAALKIKGIDAGAVYLTGEYAGELNLAVRRSPDAETIQNIVRLPDDDSPLQKVLDGDFLKQKYYESLTQERAENMADEFRSATIIPILNRGDTVALLNLSSRTFEEIPDYARNALEAMAAQVGELVYRLEAESRLHESQSQLDMVTSCMLDLISEVSPDGKYIYISPSYFQATGLKPENLMGQDCLERIHPEDIPQVKEALHQVFSTQVPRQEHLRFRCSDGHYSWFEALGNPILDQDGNVTAVIVSSREITDRKLAEAALRESEEKYRVLVEHSHDGVYIYRDETFLFVNSRMVEITGYSTRELMKKPILDLLHTEDRERIQTYAQKRMKGEAVPKTYNARIIRRGGEVRHVEISATLINYQDNKAVLGAMRDISERKLAEDALQIRNLQLKQTVSELEQFNREAVLLNEMSDLLQVCLEPEEVYHVMLQCAENLFPGSSGALYVLNPAHHALEAAVEWGNVPLSSTNFSAESCWGLRRSRTHLFDGSDNTLRCLHVMEGTQSRTVCAPLMAQGDITGLLFIQDNNTQAQRRFEAVATMVSGRLALAIANLQLRKNLWAQAMRDGLTGLFNHHYLDETLKRELSRSNRHQRSLGVIMMDLDHFKEVNDTLGHDAGDVLLEKIGKYLLTNTREGDIVCRYGGDEFVVILPEVTLADVIQKARALCEGIRMLQFHYHGQVLGPVSASAGVATYPDHALTPEDLLRKADAALYTAKSGGRDLVMTAEI